MHNLPHAGQYPLRPDDRVFSCRAINMCYCFATPFKYNAFLSFHIQDNEDDFSGTAQNGLMLSDLYCLLCLLQCVSVNCKMSHQASCGVANMLKVHATLSKKKHAQEINACVGRPFAQRSINHFFLYFYTFSQLCLGYSLVNHLDA